MISEQEDLVSVIIPFYNEEFYYINIFSSVFLSIDHLYYRKIFTRDNIYNSFNNYIKSKEKES